VEGWSQDGRRKKEDFFRKGGGISEGWRKRQEEKDVGFGEVIEKDEEMQRLERWQKIKGIEV